MKYNSDIHHRRSIRLSEYDYSQTGAYFVTMCTNNRICMFGEILEDTMQLNQPGKMVEKWWMEWWMELMKKFPFIRNDAYIIMPNHFHGIITIVGADLRVCPDDKTGQGEHIGSPLHRIVQWFKTMTTNDYIHCVKQSGWSPFDGKLWQRNYYEHIIRNEHELNRIRE